MEIKVLGTGCANCRATYSVLEAVARDKGVDASITKVEDMKDIMSYGILATPGVVIDGVVVHSGGVPSRAKVEQWLTALAPSASGACCCGGSKSKCCG